MKSFASVFARSFFVLGMLAAPAWAIGDAPTPAVKEVTPAAEKKADPKCEGITLTGEKFLDMFYAIAMHGDLTDVPFIEKTLGTKFDVRYSDDEDNYHKHYKRAYYKSKKLLGAPIVTSLTFDVERDPKLSFPKFIHMRVNTDGYRFNYMYSCLMIPVSQISQKFGGSFSEQQPFDSGATTSGSKILQGAGKDGSTINMVYSRMANSQIIHSLFIEQTW